MTTPDEDYNTPAHIDRDEWKTAATYQAGNHVTDLDLARMDQYGGEL